MFLSLYILGCSIFTSIFIFIYQFFNYKKIIKEIEDKSEQVFYVLFTLKAVKECKESLYKLNCKLKKEKHLINEYSKNIDRNESLSNLIDIKPIGVVESPFEDNKFVPRHGYFTSSINAILKIKYDKDIDIDELKQYSHLIVVYYCHKVKIDEKIPNKVPHPYLENKKVGIFSTSPIRPNPIGISIVKLNNIRNDKTNENIYFDVSNIDMINNTPIISIIPYSSSYIPIESYSIFNENEIVSSITSKRKIIFSEESKNDLISLESTFKFYKNCEDITNAIIEILKCDHGRRKLNIEYKCQFDSIISYFQYKSDDTILITSIKSNTK